MSRGYVNNQGRPVDENGTELSAILPSSSDQYREFRRRQSELSKEILWAKTDEDFIRETRAMVTELEPLRDRIVDKGELEDADARLDELRDDADDLEANPSKPKSDEYRRASAAQASAFVYEGTVEQRLEAARRGSAAFMEALETVTDPDEQYQLRRRASSLMRHRLGLEAMLREGVQPE